LKECKIDVTKLPEDVYYKLVQLNLIDPDSSNHLIEINEGI
jgi:hypothetical protein